MDGTELCVRFSYITNKLRFCGPEEAQPSFYRYLTKKDNKDEVRKDIERFEGLLPYLKAIAGKAGKDILDDEVVEAYWLGNGLLDDFDDEDMKAIITALTKRGLPRSMGKKLIADLPSGFFPHHDFNVFYVGVGNITQSVDATLQNMDNCRISCGKVMEVVSKDTCMVMTRPLGKKGNQFRLGEEEPKTAVFLPEVTQLKEDDLVALHWGFIPMVLEEKQVENLQKYQQRLLDILNNIDKLSPDE